MMERMKRYLLYGLCSMLFVSCSDTKTEDTRDTTTKGRIRISVDESFKPVIEEQLKVHHSSYPEATIIAEYKAEAACFRDLQSDSCLLYTSPSPRD